MQTRAVTAHHGCWEFLNEDRGDKGNITSPVPASAQLSEQEQQRRGTGGQVLVQEHLPRIARAPSASWTPVKSRQQQL